jgi:hypothetical protein
VRLVAVEQRAVDVEEHAAQWDPHCVTVRPAFRRKTHAGRIVATNVDGGSRRIRRAL